MQSPVGPPNYFQNNPAADPALLIKRRKNKNVTTDTSTKLKINF